MGVRLEVLHKCDKYQQHLYKRIQKFCPLFIHVQKHVIAIKCIDNMKEMLVFNTSLCNYTSQNQIS